MFTFSCPAHLLPLVPLQATSFLSLALMHRDLSTATELLCFWSPEARPEDPLLSIAFVSFLNIARKASAAEDVELFRILLDRGLDINCDTSPGSPLGLVGFEDAPIIALIAANRNLPMMKVALEPQYCAIVDKCSETFPSALAQATLHCDEGMMDVLLDAGADAGGGGKISLVEGLLSRLLFPVQIMNLTPEQQASFVYGRGVQVLAKLLHKGKPDVTVVKAAAAAGRKPHFASLSSDGKAGLQLLERYLNRTPFCCNVCEALKSEADGGALKLCACKSVAYCGGSCQKAAWKAHKKVCGGVPDEKEGMGEEGEEGEEAIVGKKGKGKGGKKKKKGGKKR